MFSAQYRCIVGNFYVSPHVSGYSWQGVDVECSVPSTGVFLVIFTCLHMFQGIAGKLLMLSVQCPVQVYFW